MARDICAVDFTTTSVQVAVRSRSGPPMASESALPVDAVRDGRVLQPSTVQFYVKKLVSDLGLKSADVRVSLSDRACVSRVLDFPWMPRRDLRRSVRIEAARELPITPRNAYIGWQYLDSKGDRRRLLLIAAWRDMLEGYLEALDGIGRITVVEPRSLAVARAVGIPNCTLMDWTDDTVQVTTVDECRVTYTTCVAGPATETPTADRLVHLLVNLVPRRGGRGAASRENLVLLGRLRGRDDVADGLREASQTKDMTSIVDWTPRSPFEQLAEGGHTANIGLLMRN